VKSCSFTLDGSILAAASADNFVYVWEVSSLKLLKKLKKHDQRQVVVMLYWAMVFPIEFLLIY